jgi:hydrogenase maturation protease
MPGTLLIGYGNPLRGDDGLGWQVADQVARDADKSIKVVATHQLTPELA